LVDIIKKSVVEDLIDFVIIWTSGVSRWDAFFAGCNSGSVILKVLCFVCP
jgi:hypothetical protein